MNLPTSLLNDFAKVTNDEGKKQKEYTAYGKVLSVNTQTGTYNVLLDGAETPIVCDATTTAKQNDRVTVSIKNRQATVTGNASSKTINGDVLVNGNATFKGRIEADEGYFTGELRAATGTFSGELSAATGTFSGEISIANRNTGSRVIIGPASSAAIQITGPDDGTNSVGFINDGGATFESGGARAWYNAGGIAMRSSDSTKNIEIYPTGVFASDDSRLISPSEISAISTHTSTLSSHGTAISNLQKTVNNAMLCRGQFTGNLNSTTIAPGFYYVGAANSYSGTKPSPNPTWCLFIQTNAYNTQIFVDASDKFIAFRDYIGNPAAWGAWRKLTAT